MADVPAEAVEFARMAVRAFYPPEYAVVADGVLRRNNFCSHADLASQLKMRPQELRQILSRMVSARLMVSEKHQQKRINYKDDRQPSRIVQTEYWYVPLPQLIDAFQFRVDKIARDLEERIRAESEEDMYQCQNCTRQYKLVEIVESADPETGKFYCDATLLNRRTCNGEIKEEDNSSRLKETESFKKQFEEDLRPLRSLAERCNALKIPVHPMDGADEETWERYVPKMIGVRGEVVDAEGLNAEIAADVNEAEGGAGATPGIVNFSGPANGARDSVAIPDRPSWFKAANKDDDDDEDDWEENDTGARAGQPAFGTGAMFGGGTDTDAKSYLDNYMKALGGVTNEPEAVAPEEKPENTLPVADAQLVLEANGDAAGLSALIGGEGMDDDDAKPEVSPSVPQSSAAGAAVNDEEPEVEQQYAFVKGVKHPLSEITEEMADEMTQDEFQQYRDLRAGGDDDDDDDVEFE